MSTKDFTKKVFRLMTVVYTIASAIIVLGALFAGSNEMGMMKVTDVKTHLFLFAFSFFSSICIVASKTQKVSNVKYLVEGGGMALSFLLFIVLQKKMGFATSCGWFFGFIVMYVLVKIVISILVYDEKSAKKNNKANKKQAKAKVKPSSENNSKSKGKQSNTEYTSLFSSNSQSK